MRSVLGCLLVILATQLSAQEEKRPTEFGTADPEWWSKTLTSDTSLSAIILLDYAKCTPSPYVTKLVSHRRIKMLKSSAFEDWANLSILTSDQRISNFECIVYNIENGAIVKTEIEKKDFLKEKVAKGINRSFLAIPDVREGSVVEYTYTTFTTGFEVSSWNAQESIPVLWSEYEIFFGAIVTGVRATVNGMHKLVDVGKTKRGWSRYLFINLPAFIPEPLMPRKEYFRSSISFRPTYRNGPQEVVYRMDLLSKYGMVRDSIKMDTKLHSFNNLRITASDELNGKTEIRKSGYEAVTARKSIKKIGSEDYVKRELDADYIIVNRKELLNETDSTKDLILKADLTIGNHVQRTDSLLYINPFITFKNESNQYKLEVRKYPLDLGSRMIQTTTTTIEIPEGYYAEELPKSISLELPDKAFTFVTSVSVIGNSVYVTTTFKNFKILFNTAEYPSLREFYLRMVSKKSEVIVFRRKKI